MNKNAIGKVIKIVDQYRIIINVGASALHIGDTIEIFSSGEDIIDNAGNNLGPFILLKDKLEVIQTEKLYSICEKKTTKTVSKSPLSELVTSPLLRDVTKTQRIPLNVDSDTIEPLSKMDPRINIGDFVRKA